MYGLSEHQPRTRQQDLYPEEVEAGMSAQDTLVQFGCFYEAARAYQEEYRERIQLLVGMETEWIPNLPENAASRALYEILAAYPVDYLVGSVHHVYEIPIDFSEELFGKALERAATKLKEASKMLDIQPMEILFQDYFDAQHEMLVSVKPAVVGHFDLIRMWPAATSHPISPTVHSKIVRNIDFIKSYNGLVEINSRGFKKALKTAYPMRDIFSLMISRGVRFTMSDDSHGWKDVGLYYKETIQYIQDHGITTIYGLQRTSGEPDLVHVPILILRD